MRKKLILFMLISTVIGVICFTLLSKSEAPNESDALTAVSSIPAISYPSVISIDYLRTLKIDSPAPKIEQELSSGENYKRYIASYISEGNKIYGLLTIPNEKPLEGGYSAIIFNHGYIPPTQYKTIEKYVAYVDNLAKNGFVVFKIDLRGHGNSEGSPSGSYFSSAYMIDAISAVKSLQKFENINPQKIGMWGHSMSGNLVLRSLLVSSDIKAAVIWAGAVYSYKDFAKYRISDNSYAGRPSQPNLVIDSNRENSELVQKLRASPEELNFEDSFWKSISLTDNLKYLNASVQVHHAVDDNVVNIGYSRDLKTEMSKNNKSFELFEYEGGGHNIDSPYFEVAMKRTVDFFKENLR